MNDMTRRQCIAGLVVLAGALPASAKGSARRVGALVRGESEAKILVAVLRQKGWTLGQDIHVDYRVTRGETDLAKAHARELLALRPDVLFAVTNTSMAALHSAHQSIPIVFAMVSDPVGMNYVKSFARPGGHATGFTPFEPSLGANLCRCSRRPHRM
jgi:putative ABC transport system substrate-binding protein